MATQQPAAARKPATPAQDASTAPTSPATGATSTQVATVAAGALTAPGTWRDKLAAMAKDQAAKERPSVSKISLRAGMIKFGDTPVKGNVLPSIVLLAAHRNTYYDKPFDPNNLANPVCFALSIEGEDMEAYANVPDENVPALAQRGARSCTGCPLNEWGSDPKGGRGKACKETRRLIILPADAATSPENAKNAEMAIIDIPVTSGKNYSNFVNGLAASAQVPPWAAVTQISTQPDAKTQFKVVFTPTELIQDEAVLEAIHARFEEAQRIALLPYDEVASTAEGKMQDGTGVGAPSKPASKKF